jgi:spore germination cell wall hydrolase CwlJ-like protein
MLFSIPGMLDIYTAVAIREQSAASPAIATRCVVNRRGKASPGMRATLGDSARWPSRGMACRDRSVAVNQIIA